MTRASVVLALLLSSVALAGIACQDTTAGPPPKAAPAPPPPVYSSPTAYGYPPGYAPPGYPPPGYAPPPPAQPAASSSVQTGPAPQRPMLGLLFGSAAWQAEVRAVIDELVANLSAQNQSRTATVPLVLDPTANDVNAWAGCTDAGAPYIAGTEGLFEALDAISQTKATDELFGTRTYDAYAGVVIPRLASAQGSAALPAGIIPPQLSSDARRISRAHEMFDELAAFTFGHELAHHYLGHTGCANGPQVGLGPALVQMEQIAISVPVLRWVNHPNEALADTNGCINTLDAGRTRGGRAYRWTEEGGLWLLDFFARLETASGANPLLGFLRTHPNPGGRIFLVQTTASAWHLQHPG